MAKKLNVSKFFAVPFGTDGTDGDSSWHPNFLNCHEQDTFDSLKAKLEKAAQDESSPFAGLADDMGEEGCTMNELAGFWIIGHREKLMLDASDGGEIGCDSALYRHIHTLKSMIKAGAVKTVLKQA